MMKLFALCAVLVWSSVCGVANAAGESRAPKSEPPQAWFDYGVLVSTTMRSWLAEDTEVAKRLNDYFERAMLQGEQREPTLPVSIWIKPNGEIYRIEHRRFLHAQANQDLQTVLLGRVVSTPPPADMRFPMRLQLRLRVLPAKPAATGRSQVI